MRHKNVVGNSKSFWTRFAPVTIGFMVRLAAHVVIAGVFAATAGSSIIADDNIEAALVEKRALAFLSQEVPAWSVENKCFSCHNNGDGARALYTARRLGRKIDDKALASTSDWLSRPQDWKNNHGDPAFSDKALANLQFTMALAAATEAGATKTAVLSTAANMIAAAQQADGSWKIEGPDVIGSPVTWGRALTTSLARRVLAQSDPRHFAQEISRADQWLRTAKVEAVLDAGAVLMGLEQALDDPAVERRKRCLAIIRKGESETTGWGPYVISPPEPFDTAVVLLGLSSAPRTMETVMWIDRGREFLIKSQLPEGYWPETTRPPNANSYSQRLSTTGWATQALLITERRR